MPILIAVALGMFLISTFSLSLQSSEGLMNYYRTKTLQLRLERYGDAAVNLKAESPVEPFTTPGELVAREGFEYLRLDIPELFQAVTAPTVTDGVWIFSRLVAWFESPYEAVGFEAYTSADSNTCGSGTIWNASSWCGRPGSLWLKIENRESYGELLLVEKQRMLRTISKFGRRFTKDERFTSLSPGSVMTLPQLVGYSGQAIGCAGLFVFEEIPLTCDDLFNAWGAPVVLNQISARHMALVNRTSLISANGMPTRLAEELKLE